MIASATALCRVPRRAEQRLDVLLGGDRDAAVEPGGDLDVVDGEDVGGVGLGDQQRLAVDVADRDAPGSGAPSLTGNRVAAAMSTW